jgi:hypothetical protein
MSIPAKGVQPEVSFLHIRVYLVALPTFTYHTAMTVANIYTLQSYDNWTNMNGTVRRDNHHISRKTSDVATLSTTNPTQTVLQPGQQSTNRIDYSTSSRSSDVLHLHRLASFLLLSSLWNSPFCYGTLVSVTLLTTVHQESYTYTENTHSFQPFYSPSF